MCTPVGVNCGSLHLYEDEKLHPIPFRYIKKSDDYFGWNKEPLCLNVREIFLILIEMPEGLIYGGVNSFIVDQLINFVSSWQ